MVQQTGTLKFYFRDFSRFIMRSALRWQHAQQQHVLFVLFTGVIGPRCDCKSLALEQTCFSAGQWVTGEVSERVLGV